MKRLKTKKIDFLQLVQLDIEGVIATAFIVKNSPGLRLMRKVFAGRIAWDTWISTSLPTEIDLTQIDLPGDKFEERDTPRSTSSEGVIVVLGEHFHFDGKRDGEYFVMARDDSPTIKAVEALELNADQIKTEKPKSKKRGVVRASKKRATKQ